MSVSATRDFDPDFSELLAEAFARIQIQPREIGPEHIPEAIRSTNLTFVSFTNRVQHQFQMQLQELTLTPGQATYTLPAGVLDVFSAVYRRNSSDTPIWPISRSDYLRIPNKAQAGRTVSYFTDRGKTGTVQRTVSLWPVPDRAGDKIEYWALFKPLDTTGLPDNLAVAWEWFDAYAADLAMRLAEKFKPDLWQAKAAIAERAFADAKLADRDRAPLRFKVRGGGMRKL